MAETEELLLDYFVPDELAAPAYPAGNREFLVCLLPLRLPTSNIHDINHLQQGNLNHSTCN
jgi:hypothetical protein